MKRKIYCALVLATACLTMAGCGKESSEGTGNSTFESLTETVDSNSGEQKTEEQNTADRTTETQTTENQTTENQNTAESAEIPADDGRVSILDETTELDYNKDYDEEIKVAVERAVASATSFEDEFNKMGLIQDHITKRRSQDQSQAEMNMASYFYFQVWDAELNNLWDRFSQTVDAGTKDKYLEQQRAWNALKQSAALEALGPQDQGGSIYPQLYNSFMEESTKSRCYLLAKEIAAAKGESFTMPERAISGSYVDDQGTGEMYSCLSITEGWESGYVAKIGIYRAGELNGSVELAEPGVLAFTSDDESIKGKISYGWDGAVFEVTEVSGSSFVGVGDKCNFPLVF